MVTAQDGITTQTYTIIVTRREVSVPPTVTAITPSYGLNTGTVNITDLAGTGFVDGAIVKLTRTGKTDINGNNVVVINDTQITCSFNLSGAATGAWDVTVTNPDGQSGTLAGAFDVGSPGIFVITKDATEITSKSAALNGKLCTPAPAASQTVSPNCLFNARVYFEWGTTESYGKTTPEQTMTDYGSFCANICDLTANKTYHYRAKAVIGEITVSGEDMTFKTLSDGNVAVTTESATEITSKSAALNGKLCTPAPAASQTVSPNCLFNARVYFEWGTTESYGKTTPEQTMTDYGSFCANICDLTANKTYHYRAKAVIGEITVSGEDMTFKTASAPNHPPTSSRRNGGSSASPVIKSVTVQGFASDTELKVDTSGVVQSTVKLTYDEGKVGLDITKNDKLLDSDGKALTDFSISRPISIPQPPPQSALIMTYEFGPEGAQFNPPLALTIKYNEQSLPASIDGDKITLAFWDGSSWETVDSILDASTNTLTAEISHFSQYAVLAELTPAKVALSDLQIIEDKSSPEKIVEEKIAPQPLAPDTDPPTETPVSGLISQAPTPSPENKASAPIMWLIIGIVMFLLLIASAFIIRSRIICRP